MREKSDIEWVFWKPHRHRLFQESTESHCRSGRQPWTPHTPYQHETIRSMDKKQLVGDAKAIFSASIRAVQADAMMNGEPVREALSETSRSTYVIGMGKAAMAMAGALEQRADQPVAGGTVVVPYAYPAHYPDRLPVPQRITVKTAAHPVPDRASVEAGTLLRSIATACTADDLLLVLISGGGSALAVDPPSELALRDIQRTVDVLLASGAPIQAINSVRKHLSRIKGGQLAQAAAPAAVHALVVSDVVGDDLSTIASGPTVPDPTTYADAIEALKVHDVWRDAPASIRHYLKAGDDSTHRETPKPGDTLFENITTSLIGTNRTALHAAASAARERGYAPHVLTRTMAGEARHLAQRHVEVLMQHAGPEPVCCLWGGEPTVTVTGDGKGGRNQEAALSAALALDGVPRPAAFLAGGTDGIDGPTDAAGAWATPGTVAQARSRGINPQARLDANDAYTVFDLLGQLIRTGPTHTNVMDVQVGLVAS